MIFRDLRADEVEVRVGQEYSSYITLLLYKDARCDMNILDEAGVKWNRHHYELKGNIYCSVGIWDSDEKMWIERDDCGTESQTEKEKGEASDSFKRACFNHGIGRELYTSPFIKVDASKLEYYTDKNGKQKLKTKFKVADMEVENKKITRLVITNSATGEEVFSFPKGKKDDDFESCSECGNYVKPTASKSGKFISRKQVIEESQKRYGRILCADCMTKLKDES